MNFSVLSLDNPNEAVAFAFCTFRQLRFFVRCLILNESALDPSFHELGLQFVKNCAK